MRHFRQRSLRGFGAIIEWKWVDALTRQLELCGVAGGDAIAILSDAGSEPEVVDAARLAVERTGAHPVMLCVPGSNEGTATELLSNPIIAGALRETSLLVDLSAAGAGRDPALDDLLDNGLRAFSAGRVSPADLAWFAPHPGLESRLDTTIDSLRTATSMTLATHSDHVVQIALTEFRVSGDSATVADEGEFAAWPGGTITLTPGDETVSGSLALMPGDINATSRSFVRSPVVLVIESDHVCDILGSGADADLVRAQFESFAAPKAYGIGSIVLGMNRPPRYDIGFDDALLSPQRSLLTGGHITLRFGTNIVAGREVTGDLELTLRTASLDADGESLIERGALSARLGPDIYEQASYR